MSCYWMDTLRCDSPRDTHKTWWQKSSHSCPSAFIMSQNPQNILPSTQFTPIWPLSHFPHFSSSYVRSKISNNPSSCSIMIFHKISPLFLMFFCLLMAIFRAPKNISIVFMCGLNENPLKENCNVKRESEKWRMDCLKQCDKFESKKRFFTPTQ